MSAVKLSAPFRRCVLVTAALAALPGCSNLDLSRFAPPGIVKYEEIAGDKPQNPVVAERIAERRAEHGGGKFPDLSAAPDADDRPAKRRAADMKAEISELAGMRDDLTEAAADDRAAADAELAGDLQAEREALKERVDSDNKEAARERREKLTPPPEPQSPSP